MKTFRELCMMTEKIECNKLFKHFKFSHKNINSLNRVAEYLKTRFEEMGLGCVYQTYKVDEKYGISIVLGGLEGIEALK